MVWPPNSLHNHVLLLNTGLWHRANRGKRSSTRAPLGVLRADCPASSRDRLDADTQVGRCSTHPLFPLPSFKKLRSDPLATFHGDGKPTSLDCLRWVELMAVLMPITSPSSFTSGGGPPLGSGLIAASVCRNSACLVIATFPRAGMALICRQ